MVLQCHPEPFCLILLDVGLYIPFHYSPTSHLRREITPAWQNSGKLGHLCKRDRCVLLHKANILVLDLQSHHMVTIVWQTARLCCEYLLKLLLFWRTVLLTPSSFGERDKMQLQWSKVPRILQTSHVSSAVLGWDWEVHYTWHAFRLSSKRAMIIGFISNLGFSLKRTKKLISRFPA